MRIAGAEDAVAAELEVDLLFEGVFDVDFGEDAEAALLEFVGDFGDGVVEFEIGFDLVVCRNVTIYFTDEAKNELNRKFYRSLKDGGVLFIGGTEIMLGADGIGFKKLDTCFYQKSMTSISARLPRGTPVLLRT